MATHSGAGRGAAFGEYASMAADAFEQLPPSGVVTAMFTDIVNSVALKEKMSGATSARRDEAFRAGIKAPHDDLVLRCIHEHNGFLVNPTGDGFCVTFVDAEEAVLCALEILQHLTESPISTPDGPLRLRIGVHTGIAGPASGDYTAATIDKTARIQNLASPGAILVSLQTYALVAERMRGARFRTAGTFDIKGMRSEQLYTVVPETTGQAETGPVAPVGLSRTSGLRWTVSAPIAIALAVLAICGIAFVAAQLGARRGSAAGTGLAPTAGPTHALLRAGDHWYGSFRFLPPIQNYAGPATLTVERVEGSSFDGIYSTENDVWRWSVHGALDGSHARWEFVRPLKSSGTDDATGKAYIDCTVDGDRMTGRYVSRTDASEAAEITLQRDR
ncbi:MAG TPA: adenylate/guanylate cyclase domain-containing protein [Chthonomonadaceae bacterium]|nr:adenylate/guanylate cyclase domain-containing protein [Chthonomonadaceae bacterium]